MTNPLLPGKAIHDVSQAASVVTTEAGAKPADTVIKPAASAVETGGPKGPEPTRYGDWERKGRCIDF